MAKKVFSHAQKTKAIQLLDEGWKASEVIEKIGCSPASLQNWKRDYNEGKLCLPTPDDEEADEEQPVHHKATYTPPKPVVHRESKEDFIKRYWRTQSVETVMDMPETIDEVVKLVNDALEYVYADIN